MVLCVLPTKKENPVLGTVSVSRSKADRMRASARRAGRVDLIHAFFRYNYELKNNYHGSNYECYENYVMKINKVECVVCFPGPA